ncbi:hypothetical protein QYM36_016065 [Artemia franciscana]|uniref:Uncharacterized protein n=1 Tax=Artemia franciscana TaxID=6661 RepID=A0AA88HBF4_ARTSF|nr:hypothetical protein QYM36_016065 [Artemia franciscana]
MPPHQFGLQYCIGCGDTLVVIVNALQLVHLPWPVMLFVTPLIPYDVKAAKRGVNPAIIRSQRDMFAKLRVQLKIPLKQDKMARPLDRIIPQNALSSILDDRNPKYSYKMKGIDLTKSACKQDQGVILSLDLKPETYVGLVVRRASNTLRLLTHSLRYLDIHSKISAYTIYVRPQLEYATVIISPFLKKNIDRIERVQKRSVKGLQGFRNLPYDEALRGLTLHKLATRRTI